MNIMTFDIETDPFEHGLAPLAFCCDLYNGRSHKTFWGARCIQAFLKYAYELPPSIIYAHNGGHFDFFYLMEEIKNHPVFVINNRIVRCFIQCKYGLHELRDSYAAVPESLGKYKKDDIDYHKLRRENRESNKNEIIQYLRGDTTYLRELMIGFRKEFGDKITIGSAAIQQLKKRHKVATLTGTNYERIHSRYYYGGRTETLSKGIHRGKFLSYDVNSMYPFVMKNYLHPVGAEMAIGNTISDDTFFVTATGYARGCFPHRSEDHGLTFPHRLDTYSVTIHEYRAAIDLGLFDCERIDETIDFSNSATFETFVDEFYAKRLAAIAKGDLLGKIFYKLILNSAYGKLSANPENYRDYCFTRLDEYPDDAHLWERAYRVEDFGGYMLWSRKTTNDARYYHIGAGASITGAARALLMRGIVASKNPIYCDTDSVICESMDCELSDTKLGAWKLEQEFDTFAIAARKTYAGFLNGECVKVRSKGARLTGEEILRVCNGEIVHYERESPTFSLSRPLHFISRDIKMV